MIIIGISGKARHGKDTVATLIEVEAMLAGAWSARLHFADLLKVEAKGCGWNGEKDDFGRYLLQAIGSERRKQDPKYWINSVRDQVDNFSQMSVYVNKYIVIPDVRHVNEFEWIRNAGGVLWRVQKIDAEDDLSGDAARHESETALDEKARNGEFDAYIRAKSGDFRSLHEQVKELIRELG